LSHIGCLMTVMTIGVVRLTSHAFLASNHAMIASVARRAEGSVARGVIANRAKAQRSNYPLASSALKTSSLKTVRPMRVTK